MTSRRLLLQAAAASAAGALASRAAARSGDSAVTPGEDLMQEHGLVGRVILIYREVIGRVESGADFDGNRVASAARIVSKVIHGHHEPEEERVIFPALERPAELVMLTQVLRGQHRVARQLSGRIGLEIADRRRAGALVPSMREFIAMYEPHGAYENSIVYPAFRRAVGAERYEALGREWAGRERSLGGSFDEYSEQLSAVEASLGLGLAQYTATPPASRGASR